MAPSSSEASEACESVLRPGSLCPPPFFWARRGRVFPTHFTCLSSWVVLEFLIQRSLGQSQDQSCGTAWCLSLFRASETSGLPPYLIPCLISPPPAVATDLSCAFGFSCGPPSTMRWPKCFEKETARAGARCLSKLSPSWQAALRLPTPPTNLPHPSARPGFPSKGGVLPWIVFGLPRLAGKDRGGGPRCGAKTTADEAINQTLPFACFSERPRKRAIRSRRARQCPLIGVRKNVLTRDRFFSDKSTYLRGKRTDLGRQRDEAPTQTWKAALAEEGLPGRLFPLHMMPPLRARLD